MNNSDKLKIIIDKFGMDYKNASHDNIHYCCPFCLAKRGKADYDYKFYVSIVKLKFICFKCGTKGRITSNISLSNDSVYKSLIDLDEDNLSDDTEDNDNMFYLPNREIRRGTLAYEYLLKRGISEEMMKFYNIRMGIDNLFGRIVVPNILYGDGSWTDMYSARSYTNQDPKYKNPEGCKKTNAVFNLHNQKRGGRVYVVEGAITSICAGKDSICTYGSSPSDEQIAMIVSYNFKEIYCVMDNDPSGRNGNIKLSEKLSNLVNSDTTIYVSFLPEGLDAADVGEQKFKQIVEQNKVEYYSSVYTKIFTMMKD